MRTIGSLETEIAAKRFGDLLYMEGIETQIDPEEDGTFSIWILDDEQRARSAELLEQFRANPESAELAKVETRAQQQRGREARLESGRRSVVADTARIGYEREFQGVAFLPLILLLLCLASAIYSNAGSDRPALAPLLISNYARDPAAHEWVHIKSREPGGFLAEVRTGQVWRLLTPAFIHFGWLHLLFNAFWLRDFGTFLENRLGFAQVLLFVIVAALLSNVAEFAWSGHPFFGGMSGVVYGLFGLIWIRGKFDRYSAWPLNKTTVQVLLIWYVLCLTGLFQAVANVAHTAGLLVGMAWGYLSARK